MDSDHSGIVTHEELANVGELVASYFESKAILKSQRIQQSMKAEQLAREGLDGEGGGGVPTLLLPGEQTPSGSPPLSSQRDGAPFRNEETIVVEAGKPEAEVGGAGVEFVVGVTSSSEDGRDPREELSLDLSSHVLDAVLDGKMRSLAGVVGGPGDVEMEVASTTVPGTSLVTGSTTTTRQKRDFVDRSGEEDFHRDVARDVVASSVDQSMDIWKRSVSSRETRTPTPSTLDARHPAQRLLSQGTIAPERGYTPELELRRSGGSDALDRRGGVLGGDMYYFAEMEEGVESSCVEILTAGGSSAVASRLGSARREGSASPRVVYGVSAPGGGVVSAPRAQFASREETAESVAASSTPRGVSPRDGLLVASSLRGVGGSVGGSAAGSARSGSPRTRIERSPR